jgi:Tol biopolymer transport system component
MGEVFKARDTRLGRTVAIKVAGSKFSDRFEREARAVAALSHPHICTLYDVGPDYLVMEFIDGKPLKGPLPVDTVIRYAGEIASALDAAHRLNIIHRDLKPANILVTKSGIKLLDFGLAKMNSPEPVSDETVTKALTQEGTILGTLQYMSPEQLEGKETDARSDIFSFGCLLYEMISGRMAFQGQSKASIIAAILDREPQTLKGAPPALDRAIRRAMAKDPEERWQSARDLAGVLDLAAMAGEAAPTKTRKLPLALVSAIAVAALGAALWFALRTPAQVEWSGGPLGGPAAALGPRLSPDGHTVAFQAMVDGQTQVGVLKPETGNWTVLTRQRDLGQVGDIAWSRDGSKIYFDRQTDTPKGIYAVPALGGEPRLVLESAAYPQMLADGVLMVARINENRDLQLYRFELESGKVEPLPAVMSSSAGAVRAIPDGKMAVFVGRPLAATDHHDGLYALDLSKRTTRQLAPGIVLNGSGTIALAGTFDGRSAIVATQAGMLVRLVQVPLDGGSSMRTLLTATMLPWALDVGPDGSIYADQVSISNTLMRFPVSGGAPEQLTPTYSVGVQAAGVLRDGRPLICTPAGSKLRFMIVEPNGAFSQLVESNETFGLPAAVIDERRVAVMSDKTPPEIVIVSIVDGRVLSRVQVPQQEIRSLAVSPDGKTLYYSSGGSVFSVPVAGGAPSKLGSGDSVVADPNGRDLIIALTESEAIHLMRLPVNGGPATPVTMQGEVRMSSANLASGAVARDGRIVVGGASAAQWSYMVAMIDPLKSTISRVPVHTDYELGTPTWTPDGRIISYGRAYNFTLVRFRPH